MGSVEGKVAVITGAGAGIGRATSALFAKNGAKVVVTDIREDEGRETVAADESHYLTGAEFVVDGGGGASILSV